jgi:hypothetical protein
MAKQLKDATDTEIKAEIWTIEQTIRQYTQQREVLLKELTDRANKPNTVSNPQQVEPAPDNSN